MSAVTVIPVGNPVSPRHWARSLSGPPIVSSEAHSSGALVRWWRDVSPAISQPSLNHHYLTIHLGGAKRLLRRGEGRREAVDVQAGALSIVPAGSAFHWKTVGPVEFAHVYVAPQTLERVGLEELGTPTSTSLEGRLGIRDPLLQALFETILVEVSSASVTSRLYLDTLFHSLMLRLLQNYAVVPSTPLRLRHSLAPAKLRRVLEFIEINLANDIALADLAAVARSSPFHFCRAFATVTGSPPYAYVLKRRIERAKMLLQSSPESIASIAARCGFHSSGQFSRIFKRATARSPLQYRP